jgi:hypothetical protein
MDFYDRLFMPRDFCLAAGDNDLSKMSRLLQIDPSVLNSESTFHPWTCERGFYHTALIAAVCNNRYEAVQWLLQQGADTSQKSRKIGQAEYKSDVVKTPLQWAQFHGFSRIVALLQGDSQDVPDGKSGWSTIMFHGTSPSAAAAIERTGFQVSEDGMLGRGVYLSKDYKKARAYGSVVLKVSVDYGFVARIDRQGHPMQKTWSSHGYHSAWVPANCGMVRSGLEENCIADPRRIQVLGRATGPGYFHPGSWREPEDYFFGEDSRHFHNRDKCWSCCRSWSRNHPGCQQTDG